MRMPRLVRQRPLLVAFSLLYILGFGVYALARGNAEFVLYTASVALLAGLVWVIHTRLPLPGWVLWGLSLWGLLHMLGGNAHVPLGPEPPTVLYNLWLAPLGAETGWLKYDQFVHAFGFFMATAASFFCLWRATGEPARPRITLFVVSFLAGMGLGALNEVLEFVATLTIPDTNVGGYENTGWDLVSNMVGAGLAATLLAAAPRLRRPEGREAVSQDALP